MLTRLTAEESLLAAERLGVGTGGYEKGVRRGIVQRWNRDAQTGSREKAAKAKPGDMRDMGIGYIVVPKKQAAGG